MIFPLPQIVTIRSEESVTRAASSRLEQALNGFKKNNENHLASNVINKTNESVEEKTELERRVRIGEITPFQAAQAPSSSKSENKRFISLIYTFFERTIYIVNENFFSLIQLHC